MPFSWEKLILFIFLEKKMKVSVFLEVTPCSMIDISATFRGMCCLLLQGKRYILSR
jgi:hypothetical protein